MLLSKMFWVERDVDFEVIGYIGRFILREHSDGTERLWWRLKDNNVYVNADLDVLYSIILKAPANIIRLPPPLTDEQREQLKALHRIGGRFMAKDGTGDAFAFDSKPAKAKWLNGWIPQIDGEKFFLVFPENQVCSLVSWSDPEPYDIGKALGVEG